MGREVLILGLRGAVSAADGTVVKPSIWGKLKANVQFLAIFLAILRGPDRLGPLYLDQYAMLVAAAVTVGSAIEYFARFGGVLADAPTGSRVTGPAFITGGSGFVGGALLARLVADGREVRALARSAEAAASAEAAGARPVSGDLFDVAALLEGMRGCDTVFHVAGVNAMCVRDPGAMLHANVEARTSWFAPRPLRRSEAGVDLVGRHDRRAAGVVGREDTPTAGRSSPDYERSKFLAEQRVLALAEELGIEVVCVNPSPSRGRDAPVVRRGLFRL